MNLKPIFTLFLLAISVEIQAQSYFQQEVNYKINVTLNDQKHELYADESIEYINNSPNALSEIYMHLWPNAYKNNGTALAKQLLAHGETKFYYAKDEQRGYIDSLAFTVNGEPVEWEIVKPNIDICKLKLAQPLQPGGKITIATPFKVKIPAGIFSRLGHLDQAYQITQWYPKPAVYDRKGWHPMPYLNQGEFYSEFGSFDVKITLPRNYVVGATGDLVDGQRELDFLEQKVQETTAMKEISKDMTFPASDSELKTLRYKQSNVHDFAWFADKRFHVLKGEVELPRTKHKVTTWAMFTNMEAALWMNSIEYINDAVKYYSQWNGDYPYNHATAIDGALTAGGGMEYPNITVIGPTGNKIAFETVIVHEVGHNWFYGMLGSNERDHPWMDEGVNSANELRYGYTKYPNLKGKSEVGDLSRFGTHFGIDRLTSKNIKYIGYLLSAAKKEDQPIELPAADYTSLNYGGVVYGKTALAFDYLKEYLGNSTYDRCMQYYFDNWKFKHPYPEDLQAAFEKTANIKLDWFFNDLLKTTKKIDYKLVSTEENAVTVENKGDIKSPIVVNAVKDGKVVATTWADGFTGKQKLEFTPGNFDFYRLDYTEKIPEINRKNNTIYTHGLFKSSPRINFQPLMDVPNWYNTEICYTPVLGWNNYDKLMAGIAIYSHPLPQKRFEYVIMPMYGTNSKKLTGGTDIGYHILPLSGFIQDIRLGFKSARYSYDLADAPLTYTKLAPELKFTFRKSTPTSHTEKSFTWRSVSIVKDFVDYYQTEFPIRKGNYTVQDFSFLFRNTNKITPYSIKVNVQTGNTGFAKASVEGNYRIGYPKNKKGVEIRLFAGKFLSDNIEGSLNRFRMSGYSGSADYLADNVFLGRSESSQTLLGRQFVQADGAFKVATPFGDSYNGMMALNLKVPFPGALPLGVFVDYGLTSKTKSIQLNDKTSYYDAGLYFSIGKGFLEVFIPLAMSNQIKDYLELNNISKVSDRIRFSIAIDRLNPFTIIKNTTIN